MFTNISWTTYIIVVIVLLAVWYLIVGLRFYSHDLQIFLTRKRKQSVQPVQEKSYSNAEYTSEQTETSDTDSLYHEVENLTTKLKETIADASSKNYHREEFIFLLQLTLKEYPHLKGSPYQVAINNLIISECEKYGSIHLSAEEQVMLWKEVA
jgi:hypothetical protein